MVGRPEKQAGADKFGKRLIAAWVIELAVTADCPHLLAGSTASRFYYRKRVGREWI